jgi:parallel beta-helix repeat protein
VTKTTFGMIKIFLALVLTFGCYTNAGASRESAKQKSTAAGTAGPFTYYVNPAGSDSNSGSVALPFQTLAKGVSVLAPGDTLIASGTFHEQFTISRSGTSTARITYLSNGAVIDNTSTNKGISITASYVDVIGFDVEHGIQHAISNTGQHNQIENNSAHDSVTENGTGGNCGLMGSSGWSSAISIRPGSDDVTVRNNRSYDNCGEGIDVQQATHVLLEGNNSHDNFSVNIYVDNSNNITVQNNTVSCSDYNLRNGHRAEGIVSGAESYSGWGDQRFNNYFIGNSVSDCQDDIGLWGSGAGGVTRDILIQGNMMPSGTRRSVSVSSTSNQNVSVQDNQGFALPYVANLSGVTLLNNMIINATPTAVLPTLVPTFTLTPVLTGTSLLPTSTQVLPTATLQPPTPTATGASAASATIPIPTATLTTTLLPTQSQTYIPATVAATATPIADSPTATVPSVPATETMTSAPAPASSTATQPSIPATATRTSAPTATLQATSQPATKTTYDDKSSNFVYSSGWQNLSNSKASKGSYKQTTVNGSWATLNFTGRSFTVVFTGGPAYKKINVYIDGKLVGTMNEKADKTTYQKHWTYSGKLAAGGHQLKLVFVTTSTSKTYGSVDAVIVQ